MAIVTLTKDAISWTISGANVLTNGIYINGDPWAVGPFSVTAITPAPTGAPGPAHRNGSMLNPVGSDDFHGHSGDASKYDSILSQVLPISMVAGDSLLSCKSGDANGQPHAYYIFSTYGNQTFIADGSILTCVNSAPTATAFRPSYNDGVKYSFDSVNIDWTKLVNLPQPPEFALSNTPAYLAKLKTIFSKSWWDHPNSQAGGQDVHPTNNMENYGRDISSCGNDLMLACCTDAFTLAEKKAALYGYIQYGIDLYGLFVGGRDWNKDGGHHHGRYLPMVIAGYLLGDTGMMHPKVARPAGILPELDGPNFTPATGWWGGKSLCSINPGPPWVRENHEELDPTIWGANSVGNTEIYRFCCTSPEYVATSLVLRILGLATTLNIWGFFSYSERWATPNSIPIQNKLLDSNTPGTNISAFTLTYSPFVSGASNIGQSMWDKYRKSYHYIPKMSTIAGQVTPNALRLVLNSPLPTTGGSYTFEIHNCPAGTGQLLVGDKLASPIPSGNSLLYVNPSTALVNQTFTRNAYEFALVTVTLPSFAGHPNIAVQAYWP